MDSLSSYIPLVDFLGEVLGEHYEVVLQDVSNLEHSIVAIKNGHISGRTVGGPLTDLALKILNEKSYVEQNSLINYFGKTSDNKVLRSSTFFIKDNDENVMGMLCINVDMSKVKEAQTLFHDAIKGLFGEQALISHQIEPQIESAKKEFIEGFHSSIEDLTVSIILETLSGMAIPPERMSAEEKMEVVRKLNLKGVFLIKGAVVKVAQYLEASEATIYRYLSKVS